MSRVSGVATMIKLPIDLQEPITEDDLDRIGAALANTGIRYELDNGRLILMSPVKAWHADVSLRVCNLLRSQGRPAYQEQGVRINRQKVRYPDVAVFHSRPDPDESRHDPAMFALVVEVVSPDSEEDDRLVKPRIYASAGIPEYWIVDRHPYGQWEAVVEFFKLGGDGRYQRTGDAVLSELEKAS